jgi:hypothetical protein
VLSGFSLVSSWLAVSGCGDDSKFATLTVELAAAASDACLTDREEDLPASVVCLSFEMCRRSATDCAPVELVRTGGDHEGTGARVLRFARSAVVSFDTRATGGDLELTVTAYQEDGAVFATGTTRGITVGEAVRVRLERTGASTDPRQWSCAPGSATAAALPRALHASTLLPNGDVLLYGGVLGSDIDLSGVGVTGAKGATLQPGIEVYDELQQRIVPVSIGGSYAWRGRVLFGSRLLPGAAGGPYTIALYGGYEAEGRAVLYLDAGQASNETGSPIVPAEGALPGVPLRLTYDPRAHSVQIVELPLGNADAIDTGFVAVSEDVGASHEAVLVLGAGPFTGSPPAATFATEARAFWLDETGGIVPSMGATLLATARLGATVTPVDRARVFVWGGSVHETDDLAARAAAGEVLTRGGASRVLQGGTTTDCAYPPPAPSVANELPEPTVFHTATAIAPTKILLAGGLLVGAPDCTGRSITTLYPPTRPLVVVSVDSGSGATAVTVPMPAGAVTPIFHTATKTPDGVVLLGGAGLVGLLRLEALAQAGLVSDDGVGGYAVTALPDLRVPRWGHATTLLPGNRLLVTGGFQTYQDGTTRRARSLEWSEVLPLTPPGPARLECTDEPMAVVDGGARDAGQLDAGPVDADGGDVDAGDVDAGEVDAGL